MSAPDPRQILVPHQPAYLPWPGFFSRLLGLDRLLVLDHVQFSRGSWQQRNYLLSTTGRQRVTVPVVHHFGQPISAARISGDQWRPRHWQTITAAYRRAPYFPQWSGPLEEIYARPWDSLAELNVALIELLLRGFGIEAELVFSSQLGPQGHATEMLVSLCELTGASVLRLGMGAAGHGGYLDWDLVAKAGISVQVSDFGYRPYPQAFPGFTVGLSALDLLLNCGPGARQILADCGTVTALPAAPAPA
jgi:WbqC-like protein family